MHPAYKAVRPNCSLLLQAESPKPTEATLTRVAQKGLAARVATACKVKNSGSLMFTGLPALPPTPPPSVFIESPSLSPSLRCYPSLTRADHLSSRQEMGTDLVYRVPWDQPPPWPATNEISLDWRLGRGYNLTSPEGNPCLAMSLQVSSGKSNVHRNSIRPGCHFKQQRLFK